MTNDVPELISIDEAARILRTSTGAVRMRVRRKTLDGIKQNGKWYVTLPPHAYANSAHGMSTGTPTGTAERAEPEEQRTPYGCPYSDDLRAMIERQAEEIRLLHQELAARREEAQRKDEQITAWIDEAKRKDMLLAHLQEQIVELPSSTSEPPPEPQPRTQMYHIPEAVQRPWWAFWRRP